MKKKQKVAFVVIKNYSKGVFVTEKETVLMSFVFNDGKNNLVKTLNQQVITNALKERGHYKTTVGRLHLEIYREEFQD